VKTAGTSSQTEFHYECPCEKARQQQVMSSLKDACKQKDFVDTCTKENQPDDDDSSSESDEDTTKAGTSKDTQTNAPGATSAKVTQTNAPGATSPKATPKTTSKSGKTVKPSKSSSIDCDNDHKVTAQDNKTLSGVLVVKSCHASRFARKPSRCTNVGDKLGSLLNGNLAKLGIKDKFNVKIVKTTGTSSQTEFHYECPCEKARQQQVISSLKDACKQKDFVDTCTKENQPDDDDSSSESDEGTTKAGTSKITQTNAAGTTSGKVTQTNGLTTKTIQASKLFAIF